MPHTTRFEYFVTIGLMTKEGTNPLGHSFLMISALDHKQNEEAQVEVLETIGFYGEYMPVLGLKPYSKGHVKVESPKYIVKKDGLYHQTFKITQEEVGKILTGVNKDRRKIGDEAPFINTQNVKEYRPGGPIFNLFTGNNCKRYALDQIEKIGIDVKNMHSFFEIPKQFDGAHPLKIAKGKRCGKEIYYWDCPLVLKPREGKFKTKAEKNQAKVRIQFLALAQGVEVILHKLQERANELKSQGRQVEEITAALKKMTTKKMELEKIQSFPNKINEKQTIKYRQQVGDIVTECTDSLKRKGCELHFVQSLLDTLAEMYYRIRYAVLGTFISIERSLPNSKDLTVLNEVKSTSI